MTLNDKYILYVENFLLDNMDNPEYYLYPDDVVIKYNTNILLEKLESRKKTSVINTDEDCQSVSNANIEFYKNFIPYKNFIRKEKIKIMLNDIRI